VMAGKAFNILSRFVVEAWNCCLDINYRAHSSILRGRQPVFRLQHLVGG
jgi:hypothetical protein